MRPSATKGITFCEIHTGQKAMANEIERVLLPKLGHSQFEKGHGPDHPVFSSVQDLLVCFLDRVVSNGSVTLNLPEGIATLDKCRAVVLAVDGLLSLLLSQD